MVQSLRVLVVDDEPHARAGLRALLRREEAVQVVGEAEDGPTAIELIRGLEPDVVFLDVRMPGLDGFGVVRAVGPDAMPVTVFVTAHEEHALRAFAAHAADYVLKPLDPARLSAAVSRARRLTSQARAGVLASRLAALLADRFVPATSRDDRLDRFVVRMGYRQLVVAAERLDWIEGARYYARLHLPGQTHLVRMTMAELEQRLDPDRFFRVHRSAIVNLDRVAEIRQHRLGPHAVVLQDGTRLRLARGRAGVLTEALRRRRLRVE